MAGERPRAIVGAFQKTHGELDVFDEREGWPEREGRVDEAKVTESEAAAVMFGDAVSAKMVNRYLAGGCRG